VPSFAREPGKALRIPQGPPGPQLTIQVSSGEPEKILEGPENFLLEVDRAQQRKLTFCVTILPQGIIPYLPLSQNARVNKARFILISYLRKQLKHWMEPLKARFEFK
jgi:hypothetical protein